MFWSLEGVEPDGRRHFRRFRCKCWKCARCGPKRYRHSKHAVVEWTEKMKLTRFLTLTLDPQMIEGNAEKYLNDCWSKMRAHLCKKYGKTPSFIRVIEWHKNGNPHLHLLIARYIPIDWLVDVWIMVGGGQPGRCVIQIQKIFDLHNASRYVSKYLSKQLLLSAPKGTRRLTSSRDIHLNEKRKPSTATWAMLQVNLDGFRRIFANFVTAERQEPEGLVGFDAGPPPGRGGRDSEWEKALAMARGLNRMAGGKW